MTEILSEKELLGEGNAIIADYGLESATFTKQDVDMMWLDFFSDPDVELSRMAVREGIEALRKRYDLRKLLWLRNFYWRYTELEAIFGKRPRGINYEMFFTIRGSEDIVNPKNTTFYSCLLYLLELEQAKVRRANMVRQGKSGKISVDFGVLSIRAKTREYMKQHPEKVCEVEEKYRGELEGIYSE